MMRVIQSGVILRLSTGTEISKKIIRTFLKFSRIIREISQEFRCIIGAVNMWDIHYRQTLMSGTWLMSIYTSGERSIWRCFIRMWVIDGSVDGYCWSIYSLLTSPWTRRPSWESEMEGDDDRSSTMNHTTIYNHPSVYWHIHQISHCRPKEEMYICWYEP